MKKAALSAFLVLFSLSSSVEAGKGSSDVLFEGGVQKERKKTLRKVRSEATFAMWQAAAPGSKEQRRIYWRLSEEDLSRAILAQQLASLETLRDGLLNDDGPGDMSDGDDDRRIVLSDDEGVPHDQIVLDAD